MSEQKRFKVMFVCIGNSCRSPMAEGFARARHSDIIEASSSGIGPAPEVQQATIAAMLEKDISILESGLDERALETARSWSVNRASAVGICIVLGGGLGGEC